MILHINVSLPVWGLEILSKDECKERMENVKKKLTPIYDILHE